MGKTAKRHRRVPGILDPLCASVALVKQQSTRFRCDNSTFGFASELRFWVGGGCRGVFECCSSGHRVRCGEPGDGKAKRTVCNCQSAPPPSPPPYVAAVSDASIQIHDAAACCFASGSFGSLASLNYGTLLHIGRSSLTAGMCEHACQRTAHCGFFSFSKRLRSCRLCSACDLSAQGLVEYVGQRALDGDAEYELSAKRASFESYRLRDEYERVDPLAVVAPLVSELQPSNYSRKVYGALHRLPDAASLRLLWLPLLPPTVRAAVAAAACFVQPRPPERPFFTPIGATLAQPLGAMWVHRAGRAAVAVPSGGYAEVVHCPARWPGGERWKFAPMWLYVAPGAGVSIDVGRTRAFRSYEQAAHFLAQAFCEPEAADCVMTRRDGCEAPRLAAQRARARWRVGRVPGTGGQMGAVRLGEGAAVNASDVLGVDSIQAREAGGVPYAGPTRACDRC